VIRRLIYALALCLSLAASVPAREQAVGVTDDQTVLFAIIGDMGTGNRRQLETGETMEKVRKERFPFTFVITLGDNIYGSQEPADFQRKFVLPYKPIIDANIPFYASLGNHDEAAQRDYELFNMGGRRYYAFTKGPAQFFALDSTLMTREQLAWFESELESSTAPWKIAYMHHPMYSSGRRHGPELVLRQALEPLLMKYGVQAVFAGHEHFYERYAPQNGIQHFISGAAGQLRTLNIKRTKDTAAGFDTDNSFMVSRIRGDEMYFESISRRGWVVDAGIVSRTGGTRTVSTAPGQQ
jgi:Calcineurin-like phosphoesterase